MVTCWALSPVGGQLALRLLDTSSQSISFNSTIRYLPIAAYRLSTVASYQKEDLWQSYGPIFMASLITSRGQKNSSQDFYGNVKIPVLDRIVPRNGIETDAWKTMDHSQEVPYSSLLGIPVVGIPSTGNLSFNLVSRYFNVECTDPVNEDSSLMFMGPPPMGVEAAYYIRQKGGTFVIQSPLDYPANYTGIWSFNFTSINMNTATYVSHTNCTMSPQDVESSVYCSDQSCRVIAMRYLPNDLVSLSNLYSDYIKPSLELLPLSSLGALNHGPIYPSSITELWLQNPYANYGGCIMRSVNLLCSTHTGNPHLARDTCLGI